METEEQRAAEPATDTPEPAGTDESPEQFADAIESDPAYNPQDEELKREKGG